MPGPTPIRDIRVVCLSCGSTGTVTGERLTTWLGEPPSMANIREVAAKLRCSKCGATTFQVFRVGDTNPLFDTALAPPCPHCALPRLLTEVQLHPGAPLCPSCTMDAAAAQSLVQQKGAAHPMPPPGHERCPKCGKPTVVRERKKAGGYFLGCTAFPACWWRSPMPSPSTS